jgi:hypothetical protein
MRKLAMALVTAMLVVAVAAPATATPEKNKHLGMWYISDCPGDVEWTVLAKTVPGWDVLGDKGTPPIHFRAGVFTLIDPTGTYNFEVTAPRGLEDKLFGPCYMVLVEDDPTFSLEVEDAYYVLPGMK